MCHNPSHALKEKIAVAEPGESGRVGKPLAAGDGNPLEFGPILSFAGGKCQTTGRRDLAKTRGADIPLCRRPGMPTQPLGNRRRHGNFEDNSS
jgi:hypothetical protein